MRACACIPPTLAQEHAVGLLHDFEKVHACMHASQLSALVGAAAAGALLGRSPQMLAAGAVAGASVGVLAHLYTYRCST